MCSDDGTVHGEVDSVYTPLMSVLKFILRLKWYLVCSDHIVFVLCPFYFPPQEARTEVCDGSDIFEGTVKMTVIVELRGHASITRVTGVCVSWKCSTERNEGLSVDNYITFIEVLHKFIILSIWHHHHHHPAAPRLAECQK